jgi:glycosyltransferase involved in cell wall biosynthesis
LKKSKPKIALFFPVYNDEKTIENLTRKSIKVLEEIASSWRITIINDGSPDTSGKLADELSSTNSNVFVIHHEENRGYGAALRSGLEASKDYEWICFTDGDDQYDVNDLLHMSNLFFNNDLIISFRFSKIYGSYRIFVSFVYNYFLRFLFRSKFRDHSCALKAIRSTVLNDIQITSNSPFIGAEIIIKTMIRGYQICEVGIRTYPREFGISTSTSLKNIIATIKDMLRVRSEIFKYFKI